MSTKSKGRFIIISSGKHDLGHAVMHPICAKACKDHITTGIPVWKTIHECKDLHQFAITHAATKGFVCSQNGVELGKLVRFYKSTSPSASAIIKSNTVKQQQVPMSDHSVVIQDIPAAFPQDLDYEWYVNKANEWLDVMTHPKLQGMNDYAYQLHLKGLTPTIVTDKVSRAYTKFGDVDFNSMRPGEKIGSCTGVKAGILAIRRGDGTVRFIKTQWKFPGKTRASVMRDHGFEILYGVNIALPSQWSMDDEMLSEGDYRHWMSTYYTESEQRRVL